MAKGEETDEEKYKHKRQQKRNDKREVVNELSGSVHILRHDDNGPCHPPWIAR
jgi:hypothetical protein